MVVGRGSLLVRRVAIPSTGDLELSHTRRYALLHMRPLYRVQARAEASGALDKTQMEQIDALGLRV